MNRSIPALYVHVPYCQTICGYCDFYSEVYDRAAVGGLVDALLRELDGLARRYSLALQTIFVGGGTPTTLPPELLGRLLRALAAHAVSGVEFTVEANPATVTDEKAAALVAAGVNRVSIGAQSFDPGALRVLDRIHHPPQVAETLQLCRRAGLSNLNLDLIFGVPGQSLAGWCESLQTAIALGPTHLSCYGLTYERGTPLFDRLQRGDVRRIESELEAAMFEATIDTLAAAGFEHYEISNYARPGAACRHNLVYWRNEPCLGIGPSAAGFDGKVRYRNIPDTAAYVRAIQSDRPAAAEREELTADQRARETAMLGLRLRTGLDAATFCERFGRDPRAYFAEAVERFAGLGLLEADDRGVRLTRAGLLVADSVIAEFL